MRCRHFDCTPCRPWLDRRDSCPIVGRVESRAPRAENKPVTVGLSLIFAGRRPSKTNKKLRIDNFRIARNAGQAPTDLRASHSRTRRDLGLLDALTLQCELPTFALAREEC